MSARRRIMSVFAVVCAGLALTTFSARGAGTAAAPSPRSAPTGTTPGTAAPRASVDPLAARGRAMFEEGCSSCHGLDARGVTGRGPTLRGVGAAAIDFYLSTGRMPLARPQDEPTRGPRSYDTGQTRAIIAYLTGLDSGGPAIPAVRPEQGDIARGLKLFTDSCSGCHQIVGRGGIATGLVAPDLQQATATQVGEAIRVGPYLMPRFDERGLSGQDVNDIARYVVQGVQHPENAGGWGIGNIGPISEGEVGWLLGVLSLLLVARIIGERTS